MESPGAALDRGAIYYTLRIEIRTAEGPADFDLSDAEKAFPADVERFLGPTLPPM